MASQDQIILTHQHVIEEIIEMDELDVQIVQPLDISTTNDVSISSALGHAWRRSGAQIGSHFLFGVG